MVRREPRSVPIIDLGAIVRMGRSARVFDDPDNQETTDWSLWARKESRRRYAVLGPDVTRNRPVLLMPMQARTGSICIRRFYLSPTRRISACACGRTQYEISES
jgi:hypothetical protein